MNIKRLKNSDFNWTDIGVVGVGNPLYYNYPIDTTSGTLLNIGTFT